MKTTFTQLKDMHIKLNVLKLTFTIFIFIISTTGCNKNLNEKSQFQSDSNSKNIKKNIQNEPKYNDLTQCLEAGDYLAQSILDSRSESKLLKLPFDISRYEQIPIGSKNDVTYLGKIKELPNYCSPEVSKNNIPDKNSSNKTVISEIKEILKIELFNRLFNNFNFTSSKSNNQYKIFVTVVNNPSSRISELDNERSKLASNKRHQNFNFTQVVAINECMPSIKCYTLILKDIDLTNSNPHNNVFVVLAEGMFKILAHIELEQRNISLDNGEGILSAGSKLFSNFTGSTVESIDETLKLNNPENFSPAIVGAFLLKEFGANPEGFKGLTPIQRQKLFEVDMSYLVKNAGFWAFGAVSNINKLFQSYIIDYSASDLKDFSSFYDLTPHNKKYLILDKIKAFQVAAEMLNRQLKTITPINKPGKQFAFLWNVREKKTINKQNELSITTHINMEVAVKRNNQQILEQAKSKNIHGN